MVTGRDMITVNRDWNVVRETGTRVVAMLREKC